MPVLLFTDADACRASVQALAGASAQQLALLLHSGASALLAPLQAVLPDLVGVDVASPRFARLNFDAVGLLVVDLPTDFLIGAGGRRLLDALGRLAEESLALALVGPTVAVAGGAMLDGVHAGLSLIPATAVIPDLGAVDDLHTLLAALSVRGVRLLALEAPAGVRYDAARDDVTVHGAGRALLAAFHSAAPGAPPSARVQILADGQRAAWPK